MALVAAPALIISACTSVTAPLFTSWEGTVQPIFPSTVGGRAAAVTQFGRTEASIVMEKGEADVVYRWRINAGSCQEEGAIQGGLAAYPPLVVSEVGSSSADVTLNTEFENGDQFAARIYIQEEGGSNEVIGCGNLDQIQ